jgi:hypothetical protein
MLYRQHLQPRELCGCAPGARDGHYGRFTGKRLRFRGQHVDLYRLIMDLDDQPLFADGRAPAASLATPVQMSQHRRIRLEQVFGRIRILRRKRSCLTASGA